MSDEPEIPFLPQPQPVRTIDHLRAGLETVLLEQIERVGLWTHLDILSKNTLAASLVQGLDGPSDPSSNHGRFENLQAIVEWCRSSFIFRRGYWTQTENLAAPLPFTLAPEVTPHRPQG